MNDSNSITSPQIDDTTANAQNRRFWKGDIDEVDLQTYRDRFLRRVKIASLTELSVIIFYMLVNIYLVYQQAIGGPIGGPIAIVSSTQVQLNIGFLFFEVFAYFLTQRTLVVSAIVQNTLLDKFF
jgi:hypothetical protein